MVDPYADFPDEEPVVERGELADWVALGLVLPFGAAAFVTSLVMRAVDGVRDRLRSWPLRRPVGPLPLECDSNENILARIEREFPDG